MGYENVFDKRLIIVDKFDNTQDRHEKMGWFYGGINVVVRLTWKNASPGGEYGNKSYFLCNNELVALGKTLAELETEGVEVMKVEVFNPTSNDGYEEVKKEDIYAYRKAKEGTK